jgi:hypothetical protein
MVFARYKQCLPHFFIKGEKSLWRVRCFSGVGYHFPESRFLGIYSPKGGVTLSPTATFGHRRCMALGVGMSYIDCCIFGCIQNTLQTLSAVKTWGSPGSEEEEGYLALTWDTATGQGELPCLFGYAYLQGAWDLLRHRRRRLRGWTPGR